MCSSIFLYYLLNKIDYDLDFNHFKQFLVLQYHHHLKLILIICLKYSVIIKQNLHFELFYFMS